MSQSMLMKTVTEQRQEELRRLAGHIGSEQMQGGDQKKPSSRKPRRFSLAWVINLLALRFVS